MSSTDSNSPSHPFVTLLPCLLFAKSFRSLIIAVFQHFRKNMPAVHSVTRGLVLQVPVDGVHDEQPDRHGELHHDVPALPGAGGGHQRGGRRLRSA